MKRREPAKRAAVTGKVGRVAVRSQPLVAVRDLHAEVVEDVHVNPNAHHRELWLRDLDGYVVVIASPDGEAGGALTSRAASPRRRARSRPAP